MRPALTDHFPPEVVVYDSEHDCPYLEGRRARLPMRLPTRVLSGREFDKRLEEGDRRHGPFLYRPTCPSCRACEAIRLDAQDFPLGRRHRRVLKKGDAAFTQEMGPPRVDAERLALYEKHKRGRGLVAGSADPLDRRGYEGFLVERCVDALEIRYRQGDRLAALAVVDRGEEGVSAVYCYWDPELKSFSPGVYSVLKQLELCRAWGARHLYLGLYIAENAYMKYKADFRPHERLVGGRWQRFS